VRAILGRELGLNSHADEARLWQVLGMALLAGGGIPLGLNMLHVVATQWENDALRLAIGYSGIILVGFVSLVASRVISAKDGVRHEHLDWIWTVLAWVAMPLGAAVFDLEWSQAGFAPVSVEQKAMLLTGGFIFLTGLISLLGEHTVNRIEAGAIRRSLDGVAHRSGNDLPRR